MEHSGAFKVGQRVVLRQDAKFDGYSFAPEYRDLQQRRAVGVLKHNMNGVHFTVQFDTGLYLFRTDELELHSPASAADDEEAGA